MPIYEDYENDVDKPLARIPLSELMRQNEVVCVICGRPLPIDIKEVVMDGGIYFACKKCPQTQK